MRELIADHLPAFSPFNGPIAAEDIGPMVTSKGRPDATGAAWIPVFVLLGNGRKVYTAMVDGVGRATPPQATRVRAHFHSIVYAEAPGGRNVLDVSRFRHQRVRRPADSARGQAPFNSIENFWSQSKSHLRRYNGIPRRHFHLFLMECEWRFNFGRSGHLSNTLKSWIKMKRQRISSMPGRQLSSSAREAAGKIVAVRRRNRAVGSGSRDLIT